MICTNCGNSNNVDSKFCVKCGQSLFEQQTTTVQTINQVDKPFQEVAPQPINDNQFQNSNTIESQVQNINNAQLNQSPIQGQTNVQQNQVSMSNVNNSINANTGAVNVSFMEYFVIMLNVMLKPFTTLKEKLSKFSVFKNSAILSLIVSIGATIIKLITSMFNVVRVESYDWSSMDYKTTWVWENLKELNYLEVIGKNFLIYLGVIAAVAVVYYIAGLIVKKQPNFSKLLMISSLAVVPILVCSLVLSPLLSLIWNELTMPLTIMGAVYTVVLLYEGMDGELKLQGDAKYYVNLCCLSILGVAAYYLVANLVMSSVLGDVGGIMDLLG